MADKRNDLTKAAGITADIVLELGAYYSAQDMRKVQTGLTTAAREVRALTQHGSLLGRLGEKLSTEQRELLTNAACLLDSVKYNVEHAKERKARDEKALAKKRTLWERESGHLAKTHFDLPTETVTEQLRVIELYLLARVVLGRSIYMRDHLSLRKMMQDDPPRFSQVTLTEYRRNEVRSLLADLRTGFRDCLSWDLERKPDEHLKELLRNIDERHEEILGHPESKQTVSIWAEALKGAAFIASVMPSKNPSQ